MKKYINQRELVSSKEFLSRYDKELIKHKALYGLPNEVVYCSNCVISNQRPNSAIEYSHKKGSQKTTIRIDDQNICDACKLSEKKRFEIDWSEREQELRELCDRYRTNGERYDCLVPGSGGKDSFYAAHLLKYKYDMNPLTVTWSPHMYTDWGWRNFQAWVNAGFDNYLMTPNPRTHRLITRLAVENLFHPFQPFILGQKSLAPKIAAQFDIPLVFYGENEAEYGNPIEDTEQSKRDWSYYSSEDGVDLYLGGVSVKDLIGEFGLKPIDIAPYMPLDPETILTKGIEVHYLGYYEQWHPQGAYYYAVENGGFEASPERTPGTYSKYNSIDDKIDDFHYYSTFVKFGIGRATYDAAQEIRNEEITREEGIALVKKFDGEFPHRFEHEVYEYLSIPKREYPIAAEVFSQPIVDKDYFDALADTFRSPHLWKRTNGEWSLRGTIW